jgi:hypothetical protein
MLGRVALVRADVSEERSAFIIRMTGIGEVGTTLAVTSNRFTLHRNNLWRRYIPPKRRFLEEPHGVTSQKTVFFILRNVGSSPSTRCLSYEDCAMHFMEIVCTWDVYTLRNNESSSPL